MHCGARRLLVLAIALTLVTGAVDAQVLHHVSRNDASFLNPRGAEVLSGQTAQVLGGVILQGEVSFSDANGASIPQEDVVIDRYDLANGMLFLRQADNLFSYRIDKETFDRVFSWIQNNGTGLYTAYPLTAEQRKEGGFSACSTSVRGGGGHLDSLPPSSVPRLNISVWPSFLTSHAKWGH